MMTFDEDDDWEDEDFDEEESDDAFEDDFWIFRHEIPTGGSVRHPLFLLFPPESF